MAKPTSFLGCRCVPGMLRDRSDCPDCGPADHMGRLLFECASAPKSRLTPAKLSAAFGAETLNTAVHRGYVTQSHPGEPAHLLTLKGRDALRIINNAATSGQPIKLP